MDYRKTKRGISIVWIIVAMTALIGMASLAVDFGRAQIVKSELRRAADAAARAAASSASSPSAARKLASDFALQNMADGQPVQLVTAEDVKFVIWDAGKRTYTELSGSAESTANAVKVTAKRVAARNNAVPLLWAGLIGKSNCDVTATSIAALAPETYGIVGLNGITMSGNSSSSYWSNGSGGTGAAGNIASNGNITLSGGAVINGNARPGPSGKVSGGTVTGTTTPLTTVLSYPNGNPGIYATSNDNGQIPGGYVTGGSFTLGKNKSLSLPGGNYYFKDFTTQTGSQLTFTGPATIYCWGNFSMTSQTVTASSVPQNLKLVMCPGPQGQTPGSVTINAGASLYADIYAPQSNVSISGGGSIYGSVLGLTVSMTGGSSINYDLSLKGSGGIVMVY